MQPSDKIIQDAKRVKQYFPFRRIWVAINGSVEEVICKNTAHVANKLASEGWKVFELK